MDESADNADLEVVRSEMAAQWEEASEGQPAEAGLETAVEGGSAQGRVMEGVVAKGVTTVATMVKVLTGAMVVVMAVAMLEAVVEMRVATVAEGGQVAAMVAVVAVVAGKARVVLMGREREEDGAEDSAEVK